MYNVLSSDQDNLNIYISQLLYYYFYQDLVMIGVIVVTHHLHMNPDNLATPVAASIGDVVSISLLAQISSAFFYIHGEYSTMVNWSSAIWSSVAVSRLYLWSFTFVSCCWVEIGKQDM
jgi:hypothetical protein